MKENVKSGKDVPKKTEAYTGVDRVETNEEYNQDLKERLSKETKTKWINYEELINVAPEFAIWLKELVSYRNVDSQVLIFLDTKDVGENRFNCRLYTGENCYNISGNKSIDNNKSYLGCTVSARKNRVGENWNRGRDLPDGEYSKKTFDAIVRRIVAFELKALQLWRA